MLKSFSELIANLLETWFDPYTQVPPLDWPNVEKRQLSYEMIFASTPQSIVLVPHVLEDIRGVFPKIAVFDIDPKFAFRFFVWLPVVVDDDDAAELFATNLAPKAGTVDDGDGPSNC